MPQETVSNSLSQPLPPLVRAHTPPPISEISKIASPPGLVHVCSVRMSYSTSCVTLYSYTSEEFHEQCKKEYLQQRDTFQRTGIAKKRKKPQYYGSE